MKGMAVVVGRHSSPGYIGQLGRLICSVRALAIQGPSSHDNASIVDPTSAAAMLGDGQEMTRARATVTGRGPNRRVWRQ